MYYFLLGWFGLGIILNLYALSKNKYPRTIQLTPMLEVVLLCSKVVIIVLIVLVSN